MATSSEGLGRGMVLGGSRGGVLGRLHCEGGTGGRRSIWQAEDGGTAFQEKGTARAKARMQGAASPFWRMMREGSPGLGETTRKAEGQVFQRAASFSRRRLACTLKHWSDS